MRCAGLSVAASSLFCQSAPLGMSLLTPMLGGFAVKHRTLPQVREWQQRQQRQAAELGYVETMLGRRRQLPGAMDRSDRSARRGHAMRAAINTPIQVGTCWADSGISYCCTDRTLA